MNENPYAHQDWNEVVLLKPKQLKTSSSVPSQTKEQKLDHSNDIVVPKKINLNLKKAIQQARLANKISQKDLAIKLNVPLQTIVQYENGKAIPNNSFIRKMEVLLKTKLPRIK